MRSLFGHFTMWVVTSRQLSRDPSCISSTVVSRYSARGNSPPAPDFGPSSIFAQPRHRAQNHNPRIETQSTIVIFAALPEQRDLTQGPILSHILHMSLPMMAGMTAHLLVSIVDGILVGRLGL